MEFYKHLPISASNFWTLSTPNTRKKTTPPIPPQKRPKQPKAVNGAHLDALCRSSFWKLSRAASKGHPGGYFFPVKNGVEKNQHLQFFPCHWKNPWQKHIQKMEKSQLDNFNFYHWLIFMDWCLNCYMNPQVSIPNLKLGKQIVESNEVTDLTKSNKRWWVLGSLCGSNNDVGGDDHFFHIPYGPICTCCMVSQCFENIHAPTKLFQI